MLFHSVTEEDVVRRNCLAKSCPYCVRNSLLEDQNHSIVLKSCIMHKLVPCKIYKRDEIGMCNEK